MKIEPDTVRLTVRVDGRQHPGKGLLGGALSPGQRTLVVARTVHRPVATQLRRTRSPQRHSLRTPVRDVGLRRVQQRQTGPDLVVGQLISANNIF